MNTFIFITKKVIINRFLLSLFGCLMLFTVKVQAVEINGLYYNLISKGNIAEVIKGPQSYSGDIVVPEKIEYEDISYTVTSIGKQPF